MESTKLNFLVAPDKFKGSIKAEDVADVIGSVIPHFFPDAKVREVPIADGGDGSLEILLKTDFERVIVHSYNALMEPHETSYGVGYVDGKLTAFLEMATICGLASISAKPLQPFFASSYGLGEVAHQILDTEVENIIVSVGGSASTDGGIGFLAGLGAVIRDGQGSRVSPNLEGLPRAEEIDLTLMHPKTKVVGWTFLVDVTNPLTGPNGAAYIFGPQKGLQQSDLERADFALTHWANLIEKESGISVSNIPGSGAAGGVPAIALSFFSANFLTGAEWFYQVLKLEDFVLGADVVITGEGSFDAQSLMGKGPGYILKRARFLGKLTVVVAGSLEPGLEALEGTYKASLVELAGDTGKSFSEPLKWLEAATFKALGELKLGLPST